MLCKDVMANALQRGRKLHVPRARHLPIAVEWVGGWVGAEADVSLLQFSNILGPDHT